MTPALSVCALPASSLALEHVPRFRRTAGQGLQVDSLLLAVTLALLLLGLIGVASTTMALTAAPFAFLERQLAAAAVGLLCGGALLFVPTAWLARASVPLAGLALALLTGVLSGHPVNGSRRWLHVGALSMQASEVARPLILLFMASHAARNLHTLRSGIIALHAPLGVLAAGCALLVAEPDLGDTLVLAVCGLAVLYLAGARLVDLARVGLLAVGVLAVLECLSHYGQARLATFLDPWADPYHSGFQLTQALIALGRGEWLGAGLGNGVQKLFYLPEAHTDFVLASLAEELGFAGVCLMVLLFVGLVGRSFLTARRAWAAGLTFQGLLAACFGLWLGLQAFINMGVNMGVLPTKGLTLPLISYGRSSLIVTLAALGVLMRVHHETRTAECEAARRG